MSIRMVVLSAASCKWFVVRRSIELLTDENKDFGQRAIGLLIALCLCSAKRRSFLLGIFVWGVAYLYPGWIRVVAAQSLSPGQGNH